MCTCAGVHVLVSPSEWMRAVACARARYHVLGCTCMSIWHVWTLARLLFARMFLCNVFVTSIALRFVSVFPWYFFAMPPTVLYSPSKACASFPLCQQPRSRKRCGSSDARQPSEYCENCLSVQPACAFPTCTRLAAPGTGRYSTDLCVVHYTDPCNAAQRHWSLCCNAKVGCQYLSQTPRSGKCFACQESNLPCAHALAGCAVHTRSGAAPLSQL